MRTHTLPLLLTLGLPLAAQDSRAEQVAWLSEHMVTDMEGLGAMVGDAPIVFLGEAAHGDGTTLARKVDMVRYLHEQKGFSVLVFESGIYECHKAWQEIVAGRDAEEAAGDAIFGVWSRCQEVKPLWEYIGTRSQGEQPLELAGFDFQPSGIHTRDEMLGDVQAAVQECAPELLEDDFWEDFAGPYRILSKNLDRSLRDWDPDARQLFHDLSAEVAGSIEDQHPVLAQAVRSHSTWMRFGWAMADGGPRDTFNLREEQGGANMIWLHRERYPDQKLIVWGATSHLSRNRQEIETEADPGMVPFGHHVWQALGEKVFMLGFVTHHVSVVAENGAREEVLVAPADCWADLMHAADRGEGGIDLRRADWLREKRTGRLMGHAPMRADWGRIVDGIWYFPEIRPSVRY